MDVIVSEVPAATILALAFVFGALWGSFFNVAIYRWPLGMSVVVPPSHCPHCSARVPGYLNLPILSYLILRGRTACCGSSLSPRYPMVEFITAVLCTAVFHRWVVLAHPTTPLLTASFEALCYFIFVGGLLIATFVDLERMEIPDEVSLPGAAFGLVTAGLRAQPGVEAAALGAGGGFLLIQLLFVWSYERLTGRRGMGEGDAKLLLFIGAFIGWRGAIFSLFAGAMQGLLVAVYGLATGKQLTPILEEEEDGEAGNGEPGDEARPPSEPPPRHAGHMKVPFGPFLALGALEYLFFGDMLIELWFGLFAGVLG